MSEQLGEIVKTFLALLSGGAIVWAGIANGWFQKEKVAVEVRKGEADLYERQLAMLEKEKNSYKKLYEETKEALSITNEKNTLRELDMQRIIQDQEKRIHILEEKVTRLLLKANI